MRVRDATGDELPEVMNVLDGAALEIAVETVRAGIDDDGTLVAVSEDGDRILGALVLEGQHVVAVAVRRGRRGQGIGSALVEAAADRRDQLTAEFDADLTGFYERLGFAVEAGDAPERLRGTR